MESDFLTLHRKNGPIAAQQLDMNLYGSAHDEPRIVSLSPRRLEHDIQRSMSLQSNSRLSIRKGRHAPVTPRVHPFSFVDKIPSETTRIVSIDDGKVTKVESPPSPAISEKKIGESFEFEYDSDDEDQNGSPTTNDHSTTRKRSHTTTSISVGNPLVSIDTKIIGIGWRTSGAKSNKSFVVYNIQVHVPSLQATWTVMRRYNEFRALHSMLKKKSSIPPPSLPTRILLNNSNKESIRQRQMELEAYLILVTQSQRYNAACYDILLTFLDVQGSPISYMFTFQVQNDNFVIQDKRKWYNKVRAEKRSIKERLTKENDMLDRAEMTQSADEQQKWYETKFAAIESLKQDIDQLRLQGDEFLIDIKGHIHILNIGSDGYVYIYPYTPPFDGDDEQSVCSRERRAFEHCSKNKKYIIQIDRIRSIKQLENTYKGDGLEAMLLNCKDESFTFYALDRYEMLETIGAHVRLSNLNHIRMRSYFRDRLLPLRDERYDSKNADHESLLMKLWHQAFPDEELTARKSEQWVKLGFQGQDPATDFRSMGMLGLDNLLYVTCQHYKPIRDILDQDRDYPFSVSLINISHTLLGEMNISARVTQHSLTENDVSIWESDIFLFLCLQARRVQYPYEELVGTVCELFDLVWVRENGSYMRFGELLNTTMDILRQVIAAKPTSFAHLRSVVGLVSEIKPLKSS
jgi:hypothetical protein